MQYNATYAHQLHASQLPAVVHSISFRHTISLSVSMLGMLAYPPVCPIRNSLLQCSHTEHAWQPAGCIGPSSDSGRICLQVSALKTREKAFSYALA